MTREGSIDAFPRTFGAKVNFYQETKFEKGLLLENVMLDHQNLVDVVELKLKSLVEV